MNQEVKAPWIAALRGGKFRQGQGRLKRVDGGGYLHCCLGVLCELAVDAGIIEEPETDHEGRIMFGPEGNALYLPDPVVEWAGFSSPAPSTHSLRADCDNLSTINDVGVSFDQIADIIEKEF